MLVACFRSPPHPAGNWAPLYLSADSLMRNAAGPINAPSVCILDSSHSSTSIEATGTPCLPAIRVKLSKKLCIKCVRHPDFQRPISWSCQRSTGTKTRNDEDPNCCGLCCRTKLPSHPETNAEENESTQVPEAVCRGPKQLTVKSKPIPLFCLVLIQRKDSCVLGRGKKKKRDSRGQCLDKKFEEKADVA